MCAPRHDYLLKRRNRASPYRFQATLLKLAPYALLRAMVEAISGPRQGSYGAEPLQMVGTNGIKEMCANADRLKQRIDNLASSDAL